MDGGVGASEHSTGESGTEVPNSSPTGGNPHDCSRLSTGTSSGSGGAAGSVGTVDSASFTISGVLGAVVPVAIFHAESKIAFQEKDNGDEGGGVGEDSVLDSAGGTVGSASTRSC